MHNELLFNYIYSGKSSLLNRLKSAGITDPSEYITFHGLRNNAELNNKMVIKL